MKICQCLLGFVIQWDLSTADTLGTDKQFVIERFPLFGGCFIHITICLDPHTYVCTRDPPNTGHFGTAPAPICSL